MMTRNVSEHRQEADALARFESHCASLFLASALWLTAAVAACMPAHIEEGRPARPAASQRVDDDADAWLDAREVAESYDTVDREMGRWSYAPPPLADATRLSRTLSW